MRQESTKGVTKVPDQVCGEAVGGTKVHRASFPTETGVHAFRPVVRVGMRFYPRQIIC